MMKILVVSLFFACQMTPAMAGVGGGDSEVPPISDQDPWQAIDEAAQYAKDRAQVDTFLQAARTDPDFAGIETKVSLRGITYIVDRLSENVSLAQAKLPLPRAAAAALALSNGLGAKSRAELHVRVTVREYNDNGTIKADTIYEIDAGAGAEISSGKSDADDKNHK